MSKKNYDGLNFEEFAGGQVKGVVGPSDQVQAFAEHSIKDKRTLVGFGIHPIQNLAILYFLGTRKWQRIDQTVPESVIQHLFGRPTYDIPEFIWANMFSAMDDNVRVLNTTEGLDDAYGHVQTFFESMARTVLNNQGYVAGSGQETNTLLLAAPTKAREAAVIYRNRFKMLPNAFAGSPTRNSVAGKRLLLEAELNGKVVKMITSDQLLQYVGDRREIEWQPLVEIDGSIREISLNDDFDQFPVVILTTANGLEPVQIGWQGGEPVASLVSDLTISTKKGSSIAALGNLSRIGQNNLVFTRGDKEHGIVTGDLNMYPEIRNMMQDTVQRPAAAQ